MSKKTFSLNSLNSAVDTINDGINNPTVTEANVQPFNRSTEQPYGVPTAQPAPEADPVQASVESSTPHAPEATKKPTAKKNPKQGGGEAPAANPEKVKGLNVPLPIDVYRRMHAAAGDTFRTKKDIGLEAIVAWLDKHGY